MHFLDISDRILDCFWKFLARKSIKQIQQNFNHFTVDQNLHHLKAPISRNILNSFGNLARWYNYLSISSHPPLPFFHISTTVIMFLEECVKLDWFFFISVCVILALFCLVLWRPLCCFVQKYVKNKTLACLLESVFVFEDFYMSSVTSSLT